MSPDKQALLFDRYPDIFRERNLPMTETCMCWGIETGDGWFTLLDNLCSQLTLLRRYVGLEVVATQVKSKYATLRFYRHISAFPIGATEDENLQWDRMVCALINDAERISAQTCEVTGKYGSLHVRGGWYKTLCETEAKKQGYMDMDEWRAWCAKRDLEKRAEVEGL
jgi:hypothetical protein